MKKTVVLFFIVLGFSSLFAGNSDAEWKLDELNTAAKSTYLTSFEKEVVLEINKLRSNPAKYAREFIEPLKDYYKGKLLNYPDDLPLKTKEGIKALYECIKDLKSAKPSPILRPSDGLSKAAYDHVKEQSVSGKTGHNGNNNKGFRFRIEKYGNWNKRIAENIAYGDISPRQVVIYLLIDDGIYTRGHRKNFLNADFQTIGLAVGSHPYYGKMCVMEFAGQFQNFTLK